MPLTTHLTGSDDGLLVSVEEQVAARFGRELDFCDRVLATVWEGLPPRVDVTDEGKAVLVAIVRRSIDSSDAILRLCRVGLPVQALMIVRSLFEDMVAGFLLCVPEKREFALQRIRDQSDYLVLLSNDVIGVYPHRFLPDAADDHPDLEERRKEFEGIFGRFGNRAWAGDLHSAIADITPLWEELGGEGETLAIYYAVIHRYANLHLHSTGPAITRGMRGYDSRGDGRELVDQDLLDLTVVFRATYQSLVGLGHLVAQEFGYDQSKLEELNVEAGGVFLSDPPPSSPTPGRNDLCHCGSGKKFKRCHGS